MFFCQLIIIYQFFSVLPISSKRSKRFFWRLCLRYNLNLALLNLWKNHHKIVPTKNHFLWHLPYWRSVNRVIFDIGATKPDLVFRVDFLSELQHMFHKFWPQLQPQNPSQRDCSDFEKTVSISFSEKLKFKWDIRIRLSDIS